jgi:hypothetical protein
MHLLSTRARTPITILSCIGVERGADASLAVGQLAYRPGSERDETRPATSTQALGEKGRVWKSCDGEEDDGRAGSGLDVD